MTTTIVKHKYLGVCTGIQNGHVSGFLMDTKRNIKLIIHHGGRTYVGAQWLWQRAGGWTGLDDRAESFPEWLEAMTIGFDPNTDVLNPGGKDQQANSGLRLDIAPITWDEPLDADGNTFIDLIRMSDEAIDRAHFKGKDRWEAAEMVGKSLGPSWEDLAQDENGNPYNPATMGTALLRLGAAEDRPHPPLTDREIASMQRGIKSYLRMAAEQRPEDRNQEMIDLMQSAPLEDGEE